jgi:cation transport ATPase
MIMAGCKVSRQSQLDKNESQTSAKSTETTEEKVTNSQENKAWRLGSVYKNKGLTLYNFSGRFNADGSFEGSASAANFQQEEKRQEEQKSSSKSKTEYIKKTVTKKQVITKHITKTLHKTVTKNNIPWWVWITGAAAIVAALFLQPQALIVKLKNWIYGKRK